MALIKCEECGNQISDKAQACPKCGAPNTSQQKTRTNCQNCGNEIGSKALSCPKCGVPRKDAPKGTPPKTAQTKNSYGPAIWSVMGVLVVLVIWLVIASAGSDDDVERRPVIKSTTPTKKPASKHDKHGAWVYCQSFVKQVLKSPGSADFGGVLSGEYQSPSEHTKHIGDGVYECKGWVDSENSFGAKLRNRFALTIKYAEQDGEEGWQLIKQPVLTEWQ